VAAVPETIKSSARQSGLAPSGLTSSAEGKRHPVQLGLTAFAFLAGIVAFATGLIVRQHLAATVLGLAGLVVGMYTQMISVARTQRIVLMAGVVAAFVGTCLGIAHGGFG